MKAIKILVLFILFSSSNGFAQEKDLKKIYTEVTTAINSALLTKTTAMEISGFLLYNNFSTQYTYSEKMTQHIAQIEPVFSYFFFDNISLGIDLTYLYQETNFESSKESATLEQTFIGPTGKMYFGDEKFRPFIVADFLFLIGDNYDGSEMDLGAGLFYHIAGNFGISLIGKYGIIWSNNDKVDNQNRIFIGIGLSNFIL
jgi:hypothetical protein